MYTNSLIFTNLKDCKRRILSIYTFFEEKPPALGFDALCPETKTISGHLTDILCDLEQYDVEDIIAGTIDAIHVMIDEDTRYSLTSFISNQQGEQNCA